MREGASDRIGKCSKNFSSIGSLPYCQVLLPVGTVATQKRFGSDLTLAKRLGAVGECVKCPSFCANELIEVSERASLWEWLKNVAVSLEDFQRRKVKTHGCDASEASAHPCV